MNTVYGAFGEGTVSGACRVTSTLHFNENKNESYQATELSDFPALSQGIETSDSWREVDGAFGGGGAVCITQYFGA